jgi:gas vesicle protein
MKKIILLTGICLVTALSALAQTGTNDPINNNYGWDNNYDHNYLFGTNNVCLTNTSVPNLWSNNWNHSYAGQSAAGGGGQVQNRFGKELPADVQTIVQQFEQDRTQLMSQLKTCTDEQRQQILQEMDQLRTQLRDQIGKMRDDARQQAEQMRNRLGNNRDAILDAGAGSAGTGRDR